MKLIVLLVCVCIATACAFTNPTFASQDPWIMRVNETYIYSQSAGNGIQLKASKTLTGIAAAPWVTVWTGPGSGPNSGEIWAPEIHLVNGRFYIYYAADDGNNKHHRLFVIEATTGNPLGPYRESPSTGLPHGQLGESTGNWAIDPDVFQAANGRWYITWSCTDQAGDFPQRICLAALNDPTHMGPTVFLSTPTEYWETRGDPIQEGPVGYTMNGNTYITYSGSASFIANDYSSGLLSLRGGADPLNPSSWVKSGPILDNHGITFGPGSVVFIPSVDNSEYWVLYHGIESLSCNPAWNCRDIRMQRMYFDAVGYPIIGYPANPKVDLPSPAGENGAPAGFVMIADWGDAWGDAAQGNNQFGKIAGSWTRINRWTASSSVGGAWDQIFSPWNPNPQNVAAHVEVQLVSTGNTQAFPKYGFYCVYNNYGNHVELFIDAKNGFLASHGVSNGADAGWQNSNLPSNFDANQWHSLDCRKSGSSFSFFLDGQLMHSRNIGVTNGQTGLVVVDTQANFRNLQLNPI